MFSTKQDGFIKQRGKLCPGRLYWVVHKGGLHVGFPFACDAAPLLFQGVQRNVSRRAIQPRGQDSVRSEGRCLAREDDEYGLCEFLRKVTVPDLADG